MLTMLLLANQDTQLGILLLREPQEALAMLVLLTVTVVITLVLVSVTPMVVKVVQFKFKGQPTVLSVSEDAISVVQPTRTTASTVDPEDIKTQPTQLTSVLDVHQNARPAQMPSPAPAVKLNTS